MNKTAFTWTCLSICAVTACQQQTTVRQELTPELAMSMDGTLETPETAAPPEATLQTETATQTVPPEKKEPIPEPQPALDTPPPAEEAGNAAAVAPVPPPQQQIEQQQPSTTTPEQEQQAPQEYVIQSGDTLWSISKRFLGDPYKWSKLWSMNSGNIANPNRIFPGMKLKFYGVSEQQSNNTGVASAPEIVESDDEGDAVRPGSLSILDKYFGSQELKPEDLRLSGDPIEWDVIPSDPSVSAMEFYTPDDNTLVTLPGFVTSSEPPVLGQIADLDWTSLAGGPTRLVMGEFDGEPPTPGTRLLAIRRITTSNMVGKDIDGPNIYAYTGTVGVVGSNPNGMVTLLIENSSEGITAGDKLIPFKDLNRSLNLKTTATTPSSAKAVLIGTQNGGSLAGKGTLVYLESQEGKLSEGEEINLYMPPGGIAGFKETGNHSSQPSARARVLESFEDGGLAYILECKEELTAGAQTWQEF